MRAYLEGELPAALDLLQAMVAINSFTANPEGVNTLGMLTSEAFAGLGFTAEYVQSGNPAYGRHLFLRRAGEPDGDTLALISHLDTVYPADEEQAHDFHWREAEHRIYGPGTVDIKGGTVLIWMVLRALARFRPDLFARTHWLVALDATEEVLSDEFGTLIRARLPTDTRACLVFEGGNNSRYRYPLVVARKGRATFRVTVNGKSAHAGNDHANGANAILQLAHTIQAVQGLTDYQRHLTFNIGKVNGGVVANRVPHLAEAYGEMRAFRRDVFGAGVQALLNLTGPGEVFSADGYTCEVVVNLEEQSMPWPDNPGTQALFAVWQAAGAEIELEVIEERRGGLSDGNMLWEYFPVLDGLGPAGANAHSSERSPDGSKDQEYVLVRSFVPKGLLNTLAIEKLLEEE